MEDPESSERSIDVAQVPASGTGASESVWFPIRRLSGQHRRETERGGTPSRSRTARGEMLSPKQEARGSAVERMRDAARDEYASGSVVCGDRRGLADDRSAFHCGRARRTAVSEEDAARRWRCQHLSARGKTYSVAVRRWRPT